MYNILFLALTKHHTNHDMPLNGPMAIDIPRLLNNLKDLWLGWSHGAMAIYY
jgi:hypothetical protein